MFDDFVRKASELSSRGESFVVAVVVRHEPPISGKTGDKAIIRSDGTLAGWVGGGCTQPVIIREALRTLAERRPRLVRIGVLDQGGSSGVKEYAMTCRSGGELEVYLEPVSPRPSLVIYGRSPVALALAQLGLLLNYRVSVLAPGARAEDFPGVDSLSTSFEAATLPPNAYAVVSTQGEGDQEALKAALSRDLPRIAFVASRNKARAILKELGQLGLEEESLKERVRFPAGLDIGARTPQEIAVSVVAEVIAALSDHPSSRPPTRHEGDQPPATKRMDEAVDPVCGMTVSTAFPTPASDHAGETYYFCCEGCKASFESAPERYLKASG